MKKHRFIWLIPLILLLLAGCTENKTSGCQFEDNDKLKVCTTLFPQYDFAKQIGGEFVDVQLLLKPGAEAHSYEPTPREMMNLNSSDLFIYTNPKMEPWVVNKLVNTIENEDLLILNASENIELIETNHHHDDEDGDHHAVDPHTWTSIRHAITMIDTILEAFIILDPDHEENYIVNAKEYKEALQLLDQQFIELFSSVENPSIIHGGHAAMGYFALDYNLTIHTVFESYSSNEEIVLSNVIELIEIVRETDHRIIYHEELIDNRMARVIQDELRKEGFQVELKLLHGIHNVSQEEINNGESYLSLMKMNYEHLKMGFE